MLAPLLPWSWDSSGPSALLRFLPRALQGSPALPGARDADLERPFPCGSCRGPRWFVWDLGSFSRHVPSQPGPGGSSSSLVAPWAVNPGVTVTPVPLRSRHLAPVSRGCRCPQPSLRGSVPFPITGMIGFGRAGRRGVPLGPSRGSPRTRY